MHGTQDVYSVKRILSFLKGIRNEGGHVFIVILVLVFFRFNYWTNDPQPLLSGMASESRMFWRAEWPIKAGGEPAQLMRIIVRGRSVGYERETSFERALSRKNTEFIYRYAPLIDKPGIQRAWSRFCELNYDNADIERRLRWVYKRLHDGNGPPDCAIVGEQNEY